MKLPRYPIYIPSKGRSDSCLTAQCLIADGVPFHLVVEAQERADYTAAFGHQPLCSILELPFSNVGSVIPARNWILDHSKAHGDLRHWQLDDNCDKFYRWYRGKRIPCLAGIALGMCEDFADLYENVGIAGLNYTMFAINAFQGPFVLNAHVYSCTLFLNQLPYRWRGRYNEDTDICLQVLSGGWCTVQLNAFLIQKKQTMSMRGGNTDALYQGDGRLRMARSLERMWPGVVTVYRRFQRPQHKVHSQWGKFDTPLRRRPGAEAAIADWREAMMALRQTEPIIKSKKLRKLMADREARAEEIRKQLAEP